MENFSKRAIVILAAGFVLLSLGWLFTVERMGDCDDIAPPIHCNYHSSGLTCSPASKA